MKVKSLGIENIKIIELDRVPSKGEIFELSDERAKALSTCDNALGMPVVEIVKEETKEEPKKPKKKGK